MGKVLKRERERERERERGHIVENEKKKHELKRTVGHSLHVGDVPFRDVCVERFIVVYALVTHGLGKIAYIETKSIIHLCDSTRIPISNGTISRLNITSRNGTRHIIFHNL